jgi:photosystem II stability/assembly factor-like uncharacterized protein
VSGFDFGALRDPDAPQPDSHHRDGVEARAHEIRAKARRNRAIVSALALAVVVAAVAGIVATRPAKHQVIVTDPSSTTAAPTTHPSIDGRFIPPTTIDKCGVGANCTYSERVAMPVTLPDGETFTLLYPKQLKIAQLGYAGGIGVDWPVENGALHCCSKQVSITYQTIADVYGHATPVHVYRGPNGESVPYFHASQALKSIVPQFDFLVFQFGPWLVQVYDVAKPGDFEDRMTEAQRETFARSLTGTVDANGYLLLHAASPLSLGNGFEGGFGANPGNVVELGSHTACGQPESDTTTRRRFTDEGGSGVAWCAGDLHLAVTGTESFVDLAASDLKVTGPITEASPSTTTTTTTTPAPTNAPAVTASFISPKHGWVLQRGSQLSETTDGGLSWKTIGSVGPLTDDSSGPRMRFADAKRGFLHDDHDLFTTDDGGAHWQKLDTPFTEVRDLAISQGVVYLVAYDAQANEFNLWSSRIDRLVFAKYPLKLELGAGPVPFQQLVFSGGNGWVINEDRTVLGGGRRAASGDWGTWKPPCLDVAGPARLTASSGTDLVASCDDHEWGGGTPAPAVYFSHDGGKTFQRRSAPAFGEIASPNATTAVVVANGVLRQTTNEGASWNVVTRQPNAYGALDLGFTTPTQGFVIFDDGKMMITYDAGATWSAVTLP